jgi:two-component system, OmpR family, response regulator VanR
MSDGIDECRGKSPMAYKILKDPGSLEILVVEDSPTQALQLTSLLSEAGYQVHTARDGAEALKRVNNAPPALVISDIMMPEMDGYELCSHIKKNPKTKDIPVILITSLTEPEDIVKGLECGADNFVTKPYEGELLLSQAEYMLVNRAIRKDFRSEMAIEVFFAGKKHLINSDRIQILDLLFSVYENSLQQKRELEKSNQKLSEALETIKTLHGIIPICAHCKKIRDDEGAWNQMEAYISRHSEAKFSHSICPKCAEELYPELQKKEPS